MKCLLKGYFHSTTLMVSLRIGLVRERHKSDLVGGGTKTFDLPTLVLLLAAARTLPAALAAAKAAAQPELSGFSASISTGWVAPSSMAAVSSSSTSSAEGYTVCPPSFSDTRRRLSSSSLSSGTSWRTSTGWLLRRPPRCVSSTSGLRHRVSASSGLSSSKSSSTGDGISTGSLSTDVILTCSASAYNHRCRFTAVMNTCIHQTCKILLLLLLLLLLLIDL